MGLAWLGLGKSTKRYRPPAASLYAAAVATARQPWFYAALGVPDTLDGRFDLLGLHVFLIIRRLGQLPEPGPELAQAVFDVMFHDMDRSLRELGVSDLSVGKRVRAMWEALHGRATAYAAALDAGDAAALAAALERNVWRGAAPAPATEGMGAGELARLVLAQDRHLAGQGLETLGRGEVSFAPVPA